MFIWSSKSHHSNWVYPKIFRNYYTDGICSGWTSSEVIFIYVDSQVRQKLNFIAVFRDEGSSSTILDLVCSHKKDIARITFLHVGAISYKACEEERKRYRMNTNALKQTSSVHTKTTPRTHFTLHHITPSSFSFFKTIFLNTTKLANIAKTHFELTSVE